MSKTSKAAKDAALLWWDISKREGGTIAELVDVIQMAIDQDREMREKIPLDAAKSIR